MLLKRLSLFSLLFIAQHTLHAQERPAQNKGLVLATYAYSTNNRLDNLRPLAQYLQQETGIAVSVQSFPTVQQLIAAIKDGTADLAMINTLGYLSMQDKHPGIAVPLATLALPRDSITNYGGCLLAAKQSGIRSFNDVLKGDTVYRLALVARSSTSGNLVPRLLFNSKGVPEAEKKFSVYYAGTHRQVIEDLLQGKAAIGGCGCAEYDKYLLAGAGFGEKVMLVTSFNDIPLGPVVCRSTMPTAEVKLLENALLKAHQQPNVFRTFCEGWSEFKTAQQFRRAKDADYDAFRALFGSNRSLWKLLDE